MVDHGEALVVDSRRVSGAAVVVVNGELDMLTAPQLHSEIERCLADPVHMLVLDLTGVRFLASAGLKVLLEVRDRAAERELVFRVAVDENHPVLRPLQITALDKVLPLCSSVEQALSERGDPAGRPPPA